MSLASDREERRKMQALATQRIQSDPELKARLKAKIQATAAEKLGATAVNGNGTAPPAPPPMASPPMTGTVAPAPI